MFKISEFSRLSQVPAKTLRFYDQLGLLVPAHIDPQTGYRYYRSDQLLRLHRIMAFKDLGVTLEQMKNLLDDEVPAAEIRGMLRLKQAETQELIRAETERLRRIEDRLEQIERESSEPLREVRLKKTPALTVVSTRLWTSRNRIPELFDELDEHLRARGLTLPAPHLVIWHGCPKCEDRVDLEIASPIPERLPDTSRFRTKVLRELTVASVTHLSRPDAESPVSLDLGCWIEKHGYRISPESPGRELYVSREKGNDSLYVTESQMPIVATDAEGGDDLHV
ncbi:MerR family transcriptional regulator [Cohnella zeiphila]|uniref:MerR family transcriptional regulator n=1 Tax=Cohnella zeiphila TaxID=2761120 RepID=A0A7X0VT02_9BACL|nr:helix-turn-helix domain-containing protein [Cohnella zeiphila]MBB6729411.1 MerR family transcriptional regulator [Cohnella zeiphila]